MTQELYRNYQNLKWTVEAISPTVSQHGIRNNFYSVENDEPGTSRAFRIFLGSGGSGNEISNQKYRYTDYLFSIQVYYEYLPKRDMNMVIILNDLHDITWAIESESSWVGYSDDNPTNSINLRNRTIQGSSITEGKDFIILNVDINCNIYETNF